MRVPSAANARAPIRYPIGLPSGAFMLRHRERPRLSPERGGRVLEMIADPELSAPGQGHR